MLALLSVSLSDVLVSSLSGASLLGLGGPLGGREGREGRIGNAPRARPERGNGVYGLRDRVRGLLVVEPPADKFGPRFLGLALERETHLLHPGDGVEEFLVGEGDAALRV